MLTIYRKQIQKTWIFWVLPVLALMALAILMVLIWPDFKPIIEEFQTFLESPLYAALLGEGLIELGITSFEGLVSMELFIVSDIIFMGLILLFGTICIAREADSGTLDLILSFPVPRWVFLMEKLLAFMTLTLTYPLLIWGATTIGAIAFNIEFNNVAFLVALLGKWIVYMVLTCIAILCSVIFMETTKTLGSAGLIVGGSWIFERFGGLIRTASEETADILQGMSLFHYLEGGNVMKVLMRKEAFPLDELILVLAIGIAALLVALVLFRKREFTR